MTADEIVFERATAAQLLANIDRETRALHASIARRLAQIDAGFMRAAQLVAEAHRAVKQLHARRAA